MYGYLSMQRSNTFVQTKFSFPPSPLCQLNTGKKGKRPLLPKQWNESIFPPI